MDIDSKTKPAAEEQTSLESVPFWQIAPAIEFVCWTVLALAPMLRLINGAPVTDDQAAIQISLVLLAIIGAVSLRIYNWKKKGSWAELLENTQEDPSSEKGIE